MSKSDKEKDSKNNSEKNSQISNERDTSKCKCKAGCLNNRCNCIKEARICRESCKCKDCQNNVELSACALGNLKIVKLLTEDELNQNYSLNCCSKLVPLKLLLKNYDCEDCNVTYYYSFCDEEVMDDGHWWTV